VSLGSPTGIEGRRRSERRTSRTHR
jgi:hypothetical protein